MSNMEEIIKDEAKRRMRADWCQFCPKEEVLDALLDEDKAKLDRIKAMRARVSAYNAKMESAIDAADDKEFERLVSIFTGYRDSE